MLRAESTNEAVDKWSLSAEATAASQTFYYILIMLRKAGQQKDYSLGGHCVVLRADDSHKTNEYVVGGSQLRLQGEFQECIAAFDRIVSKYDQWLRGKVNTGLILKQLPEECLKQHLVLNLERWDTYEKLRTEVENTSCAQVASLHSTIPMDLHVFNPTKASSGMKVARKGDKRGKGSPGDT
eukprot:4216447-Amphidinium_carterae.3